MFKMKDNTEQSFIWYSFEDQTFAKHQDTSIPQNPLYIKNPYANLNVKNGNIIFKESYIKNIIPKLLLLYDHPWSLKIVSSSRKK